MVNVIQQAIEALEEAQNGLAWYRDRNPDQSDGSDDEAALRIEHAIHNLRAAQEGDLPPLPEPACPAYEGVCCGNYATGASYMGDTEMLCCNNPDEASPDYYTADQMREYARLALAAAGGGVPQGLKLIGYSCDEGGCGRIHDKQDGDYMTPVYVLASSPQPEAAQSPAEKERDAIAELNHQQWLALGQCAVLVSACHRLSAESEEYDFDDGLGRGAQQAYWDEFDSALESASEALDQANKETQRIHATQFVQPSQPEAAPAVQWKPPPLTCPRSNRSDCALFGTSTGINSTKENDHG